MSCIQLSLKSMKAEYLVDVNLMHPGGYHQHLARGTFPLLMLLWT